MIGTSQPFRLVLIKTSEEGHELKPRPSCWSPSTSVAPYCCVLLRLPISPPARPPSFVYPCCRNLHVWASYTYSMHIPLGGASPARSSVYKTPSPFPFVPILSHVVYSSSQSSTVVSQHCKRHGETRRCRNSIRPSKHQVGPTVPWSHMVARQRYFQSRQTVIRAIQEPPKTHVSLL